MGSRRWDRHLDDCSGPPLVDIIYLSEVESTNVTRLLTSDA